MNDTRVSKITRVRITTSLDNIYATTQLDKLYSATGASC